MHYLLLLSSSGIEKCLHDQVRAEEDDGPLSRRLQHRQRALLDPRGMSLCQQLMVSAL